MNTETNAQRTPDELTAENALICEKLLGWKQSSILGYWFPSPCHVGTLKTPAFDNWADAGLILEALQKLSYDKRVAADVLITLGDLLIGARLTPAFIRAAALDYIKQSMGWHTYLKAVKP